MRIHAAALCLAFAAFGCNASKRGDVGDTSAVGLHKVADATGAGSGKTFDPAKGRLILRLDYFPSVAPGKATLPACLDPLPATLQIGVVQCVDPAGGQQALTAGNVAQDCYTGSGTRVPAAQPLALAGCRKAAAALSTFDPPLQLDVEP